jgi:hypothetical protein
MGGDREISIRRSAQFRLPVGELKSAERFTRCRKEIYEALNPKTRTEGGYEITGISGAVPAVFWLPGWIAVLTAYRITRQCDAQYI